MLECIDVRQVPYLFDWILEFYTGKSAYDRRVLLVNAAQCWGAVENRLSQLRGISAREAFLVIEEVIVEESRKQQIDLHARIKFTKENQPIYESRNLLNDLYEKDETSYEEQIETTASRLRTGALEHDMIELG